MILPWPYHDPGLTLTPTLTFTLPRALASSPTLLLLPNYDLDNATDPPLPHGDI